MWIHQHQNSGIIRAAVARLDANNDFLIDLDAAIKEIAMLRSK